MAVSYFQGVLSESFLLGWFLFKEAYDNKWPWNQLNNLILPQLPLITSVRDSLHRWIQYVIKIICTEKFQFLWCFWCLAGSNFAKLLINPESFSLNVDLIPLFLLFSSKLKTKTAIISLNQIVSYIFFRGKLQFLFKCIIKKNWA